MPDITLTLSADQVKALQRLDATKTAKVVLTDHVTTWLLPIVQQIATEDRESVKEAYIAAPPTIQAQVRGVLGLG